MRQPDPKPGRPETIRRLVEQALRATNAYPLIVALESAWHETADQRIKNQQLVGEGADMVRADQAGPFRGRGSERFRLG